MDGRNQILKRFVPIILFLLLTSVYGQKRDPRAVALAGATTTIADGIYSVGFNPGLIAFQKDKPFMIQVGGLDFGLGNNYLSMAAMKALSGDTLDNDEKTMIIKLRHCTAESETSGICPWETNNIIAAIIAVTLSRKAVTIENGKCFRTCFPKTVELPHANAASKAKSAALIVLSFQSFIDEVPNVTKYPPTKAEIAKPINRWDNFSFRIIAANAMAKIGFSFCSNTTTVKSI